MKHTDKLDQVALAAARQHMGAFAWPTVIFAAVVITGYLSSVVLALAGILPLSVAVPLVALFTYLAYTVLHEAAHGSISGSHQSLRWLNEALGYMAAWILMLPLTAHRHEHLAHHRNTNSEDDDPDFIVSKISGSLAATPRVLEKIVLGQYIYYYTHRWGKGGRSQDVKLCLEVAAIVLPRLAVVVAGFWLEGLVLFLFAWLLGIAVILFLFAFAVHAPYTSVGRYVDTSTILVRGRLGKLVTWLWVYQNYHSIHHLFPRVPCYRYPALFHEIEGIMVARGAPVYRLGWSRNWLVGSPVLRSWE